MFNGGTIIQDHSNGDDQNAVVEDEQHEHSPGRATRRGFLQGLGLGAGTLATGGAAKALDEAAKPEVLPGDAPTARAVEVTLSVNGKRRRFRTDPRASLLDAITKRLWLTGTKKGCDAGHCGACTVHINGERKLSCLTLAVRHQKDEITTIEGLSPGAETPDDLHPVQRAFYECDGYQCGACTSGQIMSAVACIGEGHAGSRAEIREYMSGNICRCGAYPHILDAVEQARDEMKGGAK